LLDKSVHGMVILRQTIWCVPRCAAPAAAGDPTIDHTLAIKQSPHPADTRFCQRVLCGGVRCRSWVDPRAVANGALFKRWLEGHADGVRDSLDQRRIMRGVD
jgi:hypothetical protein